MMDKLYVKNITLEDLALICQKLRANELLELCISKSQLGDEGAKMLSDALAYNTSLSALCLAYNKIETLGSNFIAEAIEIRGGLNILRYHENHRCIDAFRKILDDRTVKNYEFGMMGYMEGDDHLHPQGIS